MHLIAFFAAATAFTSTQAAYVGFNYGSTFTDGSAKQQPDFVAEFSRAKTLQGTNGKFTSARLFTIIQAGTTYTPISAIPAAIDTQTTLLLGLWASAGQANFDNEVIALTSAIAQYGSAFTSLIAGISVGSEDLYRNSPIGIINLSGIGADPGVLVSYINQVRSAIAGTAASGAPIGHVDTWTGWVNGTNNAVINACDFLGVDAYPYFQGMGIDVGNATFFEAYDVTVGVSTGKPVWITETGWPVSGLQEKQAIASVQNAQTYWNETGCKILGNINTWWYVLQDAAPATPNPSFGVLGSDLQGAPLYDMTCSGDSVTSASSSVASTSAQSSAITSASSATAPASTSGANTESLSDAAPGPQTSPISTTISSFPAESSIASSVAVTQTMQTTLITVTTTGFPVTATSTSATTSAAPTSSTCPINLNGEYQYPHLIIPVSASNPDKAYGTQYNATLTPTTSTIFVFDLPASYAGKTCTLLFLFPEQTELKTSAFTFNGQGGITVDELAAPATESTTYNNMPETTVAGIGSVESVKPGNSYPVVSQECNAGARQAFEFQSRGGLNLDYFQDMGQPPIGAFITVC